MSIALQVLIGIAVLLLGRRLYWLFVGAAGFALGLSLAGRFLHGQPAWVMLVVPLAAGLVGILLALFLRKLAIALSGFAAGGYVAMSVAGLLAAPPVWLVVLAFVLGGIVGAALTTVLFDWSLIVLSSLTGAGLIAQVMPLRPPLVLLLFTILVAVGIVAQAGMVRRKGRGGAKARR
jgi:hypothetical protein